MFSAVFVVAVRGASQLPAASDEHLVRSTDGLHAVAESVEEAADVGRLRTADAFILHCLHHRTRLQGPTTHLGLCCIVRL